LWIVLAVVFVLVLDLAGFDHDYENDDEDDALRLWRRFTLRRASSSTQVSHPNIAITEVTGELQGEYRGITGG